MLYLNRIFEQQLKFKPMENSNSTKQFSKIDASGTDPNRYSNSYLEAEMPYYDRSSGESNTFGGLHINVSNWERIVMIAAGSYLLYRALSQKEKNIPEGIAGGTMLARGISGHCPAYAALNINGEASNQNVNIRESVTINKPVSEVYAFWRQLENLPSFMEHLEKVEELNNITSLWKAKGPAGIGSVSWKAQILMDEKNEMISWQSLPESTINNAGKVVFKEVGANKTEIDVTITYRAPLGKAGEAAAKLVNPLFENIVKNDIKNLKTHLEGTQK